MKTFVINLERREDRKKWFDENNKIDYIPFKAFDGENINHDVLKKRYFDTYKDWIDPINKTHLTKGEIGCFLSHYTLWLTCLTLGEPILIFEDDAKLSDRFSFDEINQVFNDGYNFLYLGWLEMGKSKQIDNKFVVPDYPYWGLAYALTPEAAAVLVSGNIRNNIIPVDEYLPQKMRDLNPIAYKDRVVNTRGKALSITDIDPVDRYRYILDFKVHPITIGTDDSKCYRLQHSSSENGFNFLNIGKDIPWKGSDMTGPGGGQKINMLKEYIKDLPYYDVVLFVDGYDVFSTENIEEIVRRYLEFKCKVVFACEETCWPDQSIAEYFPKSETPYRYLNSGLFIGRVDEIRNILSNHINDWDDDQLYYHKEFLSGKHDIKLDYESHIFQCYDENVHKREDSLYNPRTNAFSCLYHGNGDKNAKKHFSKLFNDFYGISPIFYNQTYSYEKLADDMLLIDFLSPEMCDRMIEIADQNGQWGSLSYDKFPAQEIRLTELNLWDSMEKHWEEVIYPIVEEFWKPLQMYGLRDAFVMRYSMDTQKNLRLHNDASLVTGSVKLNDNYEGADLFFPRQNISNKDIPVGKCILFPGQLTHGHTCQELISGVKYSLTMWTCRYNGDEI